MSMMLLQRSVLVATVLLINIFGFSAAASADFFGDQNGSTWYASVNAGIADIEYQFPNHSDFKEQASAYSVGAGVNFLKYFSLEIKYVDFSLARDDVELDVSQGSNSIAADSIELDMFVTAIVGRLPIGESVLIVGKVGVANWSSSENLSGLSDSDSGTQIIPSVGVSFSVTEKLSVVADLLFLELEPVHFSQKSNLDSQLWNLGIQYAF